VRGSSAARRPGPRDARAATAIGCRVKSGWAVAVLLGAPAAAPRVLDHRRVLLSDPAVPASRQPYHAGFGTARRDRGAIVRLARLVARCARDSMRTLVRAYRAAGARPARMALVVGSTVDPASITNPHIRAHAEEGRLFRTVLATAARRYGIRCVVLVERDLAAAAARALGQRPERLRRRVSQLGDGLERPWRAEEKSAATAAWLLLGSPKR
jgi:hypothetical protein